MGLKRYTIPQLIECLKNKDPQVSLAECLQAALELEFATIPPYLVALWSIKDQQDPVAASIREIVHEEMLHMGLICNMMVAIGEKPDIASADAVPTYPGRLPRDVKRDLTLQLEGLNKDSLQTFIDLEAPDDPLDETRPKDEYTIGEFYQEISKAFKAQKPPIKVDRQLSGSLLNSVHPSVFSTVDQVLEAIDLIRQQGEGSAKSPVDPVDTENTENDDLAHYYRFRQIQEGRKYIPNPDGKGWVYKGDIIRPPETWPVARVPDGGYDPQAADGEAAKLIVEADARYTTLLTDLQTAWSSGNPAHLLDSVESMFALSEVGLQLVEITIPGQAHTYAPSFRVSAP